MTPTELAVLAAIVFFAFTVHAVTGFASMITALVVGGLFFPIEEIRPPLVALSVLLNLWFVVRYHRDVRWSLLARHVLPWMGGGAIVGFLVSNAIEGPALRRAFGVFVVVVAVRELVRAWRAARGAAPESARRSSPPPAWLAAAGVIHGIYATGGPPLVFALSRVELDKSQLRATLCVVWLTLNAGLTAGYVARGDITSEGWIAAGLMVPAMVAAIGAGSLVHGRIDAGRFRIAVYIVLVGAALGLVLRP